MVESGQHSDAIGTQTPNEKEEGKRLVLVGSKESGSKVLGSKRPGLKESELYAGRKRRVGSKPSLDRNYAPTYRFSNAAEYVDVEQDDLSAESVILPGEYYSPDSDDCGILEDDFGLERSLDTRFEFERSVTSSSRHISAAKEGLDRTKSLRTPRPSTVSAADFRGSPGRAWDVEESFQKHTQKRSDRYTERDAERCSQKDCLKESERHSRQRSLSCTPGSPCSFSATELGASLSELARGTHRFGNATRYPNKHIDGKCSHTSSGTVTPRGYPPTFPVTFKLYRRDNEAETFADKGYSPNSTVNEGSPSNIYTREDPSDDPVVLSQDSDSGCADLDGSDGLDCSLISCESSSNHSLSNDHLSGLSTDSLSSLSNDPSAGSSAARSRNRCSRSKRSLSLVSSRHQKPKPNPKPSRPTDPPTSLTPLLTAAAGLSLVAGLSFSAGYALGRRSVGRFSVAG